MNEVKRLYYTDRYATGLLKRFGYVLNVHKTTFNGKTTKYYTITHEERVICLCCSSLKHVFWFISGVYAENRVYSEVAEYLELF